VWIRRGYPPDFIPPMLGLPLSSQPVPWRLPDEETIYRDLEILGESADRLQLRRAEITSPGGFNFEGLGALAPKPA